MLKSKFRRYLPVYLVGLAVLCFVGFAQADYVVKPVSATVSSYNGVDYDATNVIDASGLASDVVTDDPVPATWPGTDTDNQNTMWLTSTLPTVQDPQWIEFDLGDTYSVTGFNVWNYSMQAFGVNFNRGAKDVMVQYKDGTDTWVDAEQMVFSIATAAFGYTGEQITLTDTIEAQNIRFSISSNYGGTALGLQEVRFVAVPEPATMALLAVGGIATAIRRKRK